jgi:thiamine biosynthesis lipoprotein
MRSALKQGALATSGNYRRFFIDPSGQKIAHTIDPHTGKSRLSRLLSATVVADECARADAMATMFMALGEEKGVALLEKHPEWPVLLILAPEKEGDSMICHLSPAMEELILK